FGLAGLVAMRAAQVALVRDVEDHCGQWKRRERDDLGGRGRRDADLSDRLHARELGDRGLRVAERLRQFLARARTLVERSKHRVARFVELEDRRAGDQIHERSARRLETMM